MILKIFLTLWTIIILNSCGSYPNNRDIIIEKLGGNEKPDSDNSGNSGTDLLFKTVSQKIFEPQCIKCHQNYALYDSVKQDLDKIVQSVDTNRMPKNAQPLTDEQKKLLTDWVSGGAKNNSAPIEDPIDNTLQPNWASLSKNIFSGRCILCHSANGEAKFLDLSSRQKFFEAYNRKFGEKLLLNFEKPEESYLLEVVLDVDEPMPPKYSKLQLLNKNEIEVLAEWIRLGLP